MMAVISTGSVCIDKADELIVAADFFRAKGGTSTPLPFCSGVSYAYCIVQSGPPPASPIGIETLYTVSLRPNTPTSRLAPPLLPPEMIIKNMSHAEEPPFGPSHRHDPAHLLK
jgi:hypothetical protein